MADQRNIVIVGGSIAGLNSTHYILRHILPSLKAKHSVKYHVYLINSSSDWFFRIASPRIAASTDRMPVEKALFNIPEAFKQYSTNDFTFIEATVTSLDPSARTVTFKNPAASDDEHLPYHAIIIATGSHTHDPVFSMTSTTDVLLSAIRTRNEKVASAKDIVIAGGGPTAVEYAAEIAEHLNGKPGWFSDAPRKVNITLITAGSQLLPVLRPAIAKIAEQKLKRLGVDVVYETRVEETSISAEGRTTIRLSKGQTLEADLFVPAYGVVPNSSFLPSSLLNEAGYLKTNKQTLRVDAAGPRVYALGDVGDYSRNSGPDIADALPALMINLKRDLLSYDPAKPDKKPEGKDRIYTPNLKETQFVPIGTGGGVGAMFGWKAPGWLVWLFKGRDMMVGFAGPLVTGDRLKKEFQWKGDEVVA
ncbi:FAD/NAD(P)-binding domain-containing protein [Westerdykella ornata]|uniref:FAD/NAD(P)-binding domain-containing protein n=1 Tax=Westerdykella ornata TaxID=318751 RepID=A0A6A6JS77_WESOR|nr:FAD/NAD(P)-binding domain-containing protein [Westerdykella ornata]KAF2277819.1 FAD/NAD(P)-binding domain-containing protein [Westerdykella ornata]